MRFLHTMIRVGNLERSIAFYTEILGMQLLRQREFPVRVVTLAKKLQSRAFHCFLHRNSRHAASSPA